MGAFKRAEDSFAKVLQIAVVISVPVIQAAQPSSFRSLLLRFSIASAPFVFRISSASCRFDKGLTKLSRLVIAWIENTLYSHSFYGSHRGTPGFEAVFASYLRAQLAWPGEMRYIDLEKRQICETWSEIVSLHFRVIDTRYPSRLVCSCDDEISDRHHWKAIGKEKGRPAILWIQFSKKRRGLQLYERRFAWVQSDSTWLPVLEGK